MQSLFFLENMLLGRVGRELSGILSASFKQILLGLKGDVFGVDTEEGVQLVDSENWREVFEEY